MGLLFPAKGAQLRGGGEAHSHLHRARLPPAIQQKPWNPENPGFEKCTWATIHPTTPKSLLPLG